MLGLAGSYIAGGGEAVDLQIRDADPHVEVMRQGGPIFIMTKSTEIPMLHGSYSCDFIVLPGVKAREVGFTHCKTFLTDGLNLHSLGGFFASLKLDQWRNSCGRKGSNEFFSSIALLRLGDGFSDERSGD